MGKCPWFKVFLLAFFAVLPWAGLAGEERFALVIGNGAYSGLTKLKNPVNDASDVAAALRTLGFQVDLLTDSSLDAMENSVVRLGNELSQSPGSYGFFFYAGHGIQSDGINYLIPADASIAAEAFLKSKALSAQSVLDTLQRAHNGLNVVVLDACRDNPFGWARGGARGLSVVSSQPPGSIIAFATSAGSVAQDGDGRNGLFTSQLLKYLKSPGLEIKEVFNRTGADVTTVSNNKQVPAIYSQFFKSAYLAGAPTDQAALPVAAEAQGGAPTGLRAGLVSEWLFEGSVKDTVARRFSKAEDVTLGPDRFGRDKAAAYFNGQTSRLSLGTVFDGPTTDWSISLWCKLDHLTRSDVFTRSPLICNWNRYREGAQKGWTIDFDYDPAEHKSPITVAAFDGKSESWAGVQPVNTEEFEKSWARRWIHVCLVVSQGKSKFYLDGALASESPVVQAMVPDLETPVYLGYCGIDRNRSGHDVDFFAGALDDVRIYKRALTEDDVLALLDEKAPTSADLAAMNAQQPIAREGLVSEWLFDGTAKDSVKRRLSKVVDVTFVKDRFGKENSAAHFNGSSSGIELGSVFADPVQEMTASVWFKIDRLTRGQTPQAGVVRTVFLSSWNRYIENANSGLLWSVFVNENEKQAFFDATLGDGHNMRQVNGGARGISDFERAYDGTWRFGCLVFQNGQTTMYLDGEKLFQGYGGAVVGAPTDGVWLGKAGIDGEKIDENHWRPTDFFTGDLDDVRIYNRALKEDEIAALWDDRPEAQR